jgi:hypothetical protein
LVGKTAAAADHDFAPSDRPSLVNSLLNDKSRHWAAFGRIYRHILWASREHFAVYGFKRMPFSVSSRWFKGQCEISTYEPALQVGMPCEIRVNKAKLTRRSKAALATTVLSYWLCGDILVGAQGLEPWTR